MSVHSGHPAHSIAVALAVIASVASAAGRPHESAIVEPLASTWEYSHDGGKTFVQTPPTGAPPKKTVHCVLRGTFAVAKPDEVAGLWVALTSDAAHPTPSICPGGDINVASGGYYKDLGKLPCLLNARITLNGRPVRLPHGGLVYVWLPLEGGLQKGRNTVTLRGDAYTYWIGKPFTTLAAKLVLGKPQPPTIYNGPLLGDFGEDYFTFACRTHLPADLVVEATPTEPAAKPITVVSKHRIWHRIRVPVPQGTRRVSYTLTAKVGPHKTTRGPFRTTLPDVNAKTFRFVAFGNVRAHRYALAGWERGTAIVRDLNPAFILHTGNASEHGSWEWTWEERYFEKGGMMLASIPTFIAPCYRDFNGAVNELHYTPGPRGYGHSWTKVIGPVRLICLDGNHWWKPDGHNTRWLEAVLREAEEKFVVVMNAYPGYSSGRSSRKLNVWTKQTRHVILPLLGKYKATCLLSGWDPDYERCEPTLDKGCTQIVTGAFGKTPYRRSGRASRNNPFSGKTKDRDHCFYYGLHVCVFDVKADTLEMTVRGFGGKSTKVDELPVVDRKVFPARSTGQ
jgi:hypothetical protein